MTLAFIIGSTISVLGPRVSPNRVIGVADTTQVEKVIVLLGELMVWCACSGFSLAVWYGCKQRAFYSLWCKNVNDLYTWAVLLT